MRRSRPCLLRLLIQNRKNGPNRLQRGDFIMSGGEGGHIFVHPSYQGHYSKAEFAVYVY